ncbi:MAG: hypothetical protein WA652_20460 [Xanthobacteraceae bacterium]
MARRLALPGFLLLPIAAPRAAIGCAASVVVSSGMVSWQRQMSEAIDESDAATIDKSKSLTEKEVSDFRRL